MTLDNWQSKGRGLPFVNGSGAIVPAFACMAISSATIEANEIVITIAKPTTANIAAGPSVLLFNGETAVPIGGKGFATVEPVCTALANDTIAINAECGPFDGSWELKSTGTGFWKLAADTTSDPKGLLVRAAAGGGSGSECQLFLTPGGGIAARSGTTVSSATCTEYKLVGSTLTTNTATQTVYNPWPVAIPGTFYITATKEAITGLWIAEFPGVLNVQWATPNLRQTLDGTNYSNIDTAETCTASGVTVADGDYGDIIVSSSGTVWTIDVGVVTNAKMADMPDGTFKGRTLGGGSGAPVDLTPAQARLILRNNIYALAFNATQNWNLANGLIQTVTATSNFTLQIPTGAAAGETAYIYVTQDGTGSRVISFASGFKAPGGIASIILSTSAGSVDRLEMFFLSASEIHVNISKAFS